MRLCPCCKVELIPKRIPTYYGRYIEIDQCPKCQGVWFDKWELVESKPEEVKNLLSIIDLSLNCIPTTCPNDGTSLELLKDPLIPKDILIYYCPTCLGTWVSPEALIKYKEFQINKQMKKEEKDEFPKELGEKIDKLLSYEERESNNEVENLESKMAGLVSAVLLILKLLSYFLRR